MIINGKYNSAVVFTETIEDTAVEQIKGLLDIEMFSNSNIRIMPDVHAGKGCVIGFTADLGDKVIPDIVGVDIGCGMLTVKLGQVDINLKELDDFINESIPSGYEINRHKQYDYIDELEKLICLRNLREGVKKWNRAIGSLGGGNHFIEINVDEQLNKYLVIHSGSRNIGNQVAKYYQQLAVDYHSGLKEDYMIERQRIIDDYKSSGRRKEIQEALKVLKENTIKEPSIPKEYCYLEGNQRDDYLHDMRICQRFAELNREVIAKRILDFLFPGKTFDMFHTVHNFIDFDDNIIRKGAIKAYEGETVLIPINMRDGSILGIGKGNKEWNFSAPHGAGRKMSRKMAKENLNMVDFTTSMDGVYTTSVCEQTLDESPMAYKSKEEIISNIKESVDIVSISKPIYNFKSKN